MMSTPKRSVKRRWISAGSASPAETASRTDWKAPAGRSAASSAAKNVGPAKNSVGRSSITLATTPPGAGRAGSRTAVAPAARGKNRELPMPYAKNSRATEKHRSSGRMPRTCRPYPS